MLLSVYEKLCVCGHVEELDSCRGSFRIRNETLNRYFVTLHSSLLDPVDVSSY